MSSGTFDLQTTLIAVGAALAIIILLTIIFGVARRRQSLKRDEAKEVEKQAQGPYAASKERPYMKAAAPPLPLPPVTPPVVAPPLPAPPPIAAPPLAVPPVVASPPAAPVAADPPLETTSAPPPAVATGVPAPDDDVDVSPPPIPLAGDFAGIALPPHSTDHPDALTRLKGVGPKLEALLNQEGITRYEQLASLDEGELAALETRLGAFKGRLTRDRVVEQARMLASGHTQEFEATFGKLGG